MDAAWSIARQRFVSLLWEGNAYESVTGNGDCTSPEHTLIAADLPDTLCWADINYADMERSGWEAVRHTARLQQILEQNGPQRLREDADYRDRMIAALRFWLLHDFINPNWWHNDIGTPRAISDISLMMWEVLPCDLQERALAILSRGSLKQTPRIAQWTGANLIWGINNSIKHALLTKDTALLSLAANRAWEEMHYDAEGIQEDGAFCQHGRRYYSGGYGSSFTYDVALLIYVLHGTPWQIPDDRLHIYLQHVLDGQRVMSKNGYFDYCGIGREFARYTNVRRTNLHKGIVLLSRTEGLPRADEIAAFARENARPAAVCDDSDADVTRFYSSIQLLCHRKCGSYIGVKGHNERLYDAELCNGEGELAYNLSYGTHTCLARRGDEYDSISPLWDFAHIPGTTARVENDEQLHAHRDWWCLPLPNDHAGGLTDGDCGILYERPQHDGITAHVAFFTYDGALVSLGAGITDEHPERGALTTTVDQCHAKETQIDRATPPSHVSNGAWCYFNLDPQTTFRAEVNTVCGSWRRNNHSVPDAPVTGDVFLLYIPVEPSHPRFAYLAAPLERGGGNVRVLRNDTACQAIVATRVDGGKTLMAVFHEDTTLTLPDGTSLRGSARHCLILPCDC